VSAVRLGLRALGLTAVTATLWLAWLAGALPAALAGRSARWRGVVLQGWALGVACVLGMRVRLSGQLGRAPCLLVANHLSYLDVVVLAGLRPCAFVAKSEVARWPLVGFLARSMGTLFVVRERKRELPRLAREMRALLAAGHGVVLFPEGTSTAGDGVRAFHPALLEPAVALGLPVRTATLSYRTAPGDPPAALAVCWWGEMTFVRHFLALLCLRPFEARITLGAEALRDTDRKRLARALHGEVARHLALVPEVARV